jgi:tetratricopeptide (TPR) repeat protein
MAVLESRLISRLGHLAQPVHERWEGGVIRLPMWVDDDHGGPPYRPCAAIWVSPLRHKMHVRLLEPDQDPQQAMLDLFVEFATSSKLADCLASTVQVPDEEQAHALRDALGSLPVDVVARRELPHLADVVNQMLVHGGERPPAGMLAAPGVTLDAMRAFAEAARAFWRAHPWTELRSDDLIRIEAPELAPDMRLATVLGSEGTLRGLGFYRSISEHAEIDEEGVPLDALAGRRWLLTFGPAWDMAPDDVDVWERESLPLGASDAFPLLTRLEVGGEPRRPDAEQLAWFEGILRAIADSSPEELDGGRWTRTVETSQGSMQFQLALVDLVDERESRDEQSDPDEEEFAATVLHDFLQERELSAIQNLRGNESAEHLATALVFEAREIGGRRQLQLVRRALSLWPDCADAHILLGDREADHERALVHYQEALRAGERLLPPHATLDPVPEDEFGADPLTRPYLRARARVADALLALDRYEEARDHMLALVRLDSSDKQGQRITLLQAAIEHGDQETGREVQRRFPDDDSAIFLYGSSLHAWMAGDRAMARSLLRRALRANRRAPKYLIGREDWPQEHVYLYEPGGESEAIMIAQRFGVAWHTAPGAVEWLKREIKR